MVRDRPESQLFYIFLDEHSNYSIWFAQAQEGGKKSLATLLLSGILASVLGSGHYVLVCTLIPWEVAGLL